MTCAESTRKEPKGRLHIIYFQFIMSANFQIPINSLLNEAFDEQLAFQRALREFVGGIDSAYLKEHEEFFVGFEGSFGSKHVTPRSLTSRFIGNLVCVEGIVTKCELHI